VHGVEGEAVRRVQQVLRARAVPGGRGRRPVGGGHRGVLAERERPAAALDLHGRGVAARVLELARQRRADADDDLLSYEFRVSNFGFRVLDPGWFMRLVSRAVCCRERKQ